MIRELCITYRIFSGQAKTILFLKKAFNYVLLVAIKYNMCHAFLKNNQLEDCMGFKKMNKEFSFAPMK